MTALRPRITLPLLLTMTFAACASMGASGSSGGDVTFVVRNAAQASLRVEACGPERCAEPEVLRPGRRTNFTFPLSETHSRYNIVAMHGNRIVERRALDVHEPGTIRIVLDPGDPVP